MGFFNWGNNRESPPVIRKTAPPLASRESLKKPEVIKPAEPVQPPEPVLEAEPQREVESPRLITNEPLPEMPVMVEPLPDSDELVEVDPLFERVSEIEQDPEPVEDQELRHLADTINKENPGGLYFSEGRDLRGNTTKISPYAWVIEKIYKDAFIRQDGKKDTVHKVVLHPVGNPDVTTEYNLTEFYDRLVKRPKPEKSEAK